MRENLDSKVLVPSPADAVTAREQGTVSLSNERSRAVCPAKGIWMTWLLCKWYHFPSVTVEGVYTLSGPVTHIVPALKCPSQAWNPETVTLDLVACCPVECCSESETLDKLVAYPPYTFLMNRPLGLIKGEKKINCCSQQLQIIYIAFVLMANKRAKACGDSPGWL